MGARPNRFLRVFGTDDYDLQFTGAITYYITSGLATVINIILRLALIKAERTVDLPDNSNNVQNIEEEDQRRMAMRGMVMPFGVMNNYKSKLVLFARCSFSLV